MDTFWFAVDRDGHVAMFSTGETGAYPGGAARSNFPDADILEAIRVSLPAQGESGAAPARQSAATRLGLFTFGALDEYLPFQGRYGLKQRPEAPLHIDQLPPELRKRLRQLRFGDLSFESTETVQPAERFECDCYDRGAEDAYLAKDGVTLRPTPGREDRFAEFCERLRREQPEVAARLRFEGPPESRPAQQ